MATTILMIRHADVENPRRILYGHLPGFGLSELGRLQAREVGDRLRGAGVRRIVHSPLERAAETAGLIAARLEEPVPLVPEADLREAEFSRYLQGVPYWQVPLRRPLWFAHKARRGLVPGDESIAALGGRVLRVARLLAGEHPGEISAIVSHADPLQAAWILIEGRPHNEREMYRRVVDRAGTIELEFEDGAIKAHRYVAPPQVKSPPAPAPTGAGP